MLERILTGGQTGVDQAAWRAARSVGLATGGWMPRGFRTENGPRPEFDRLYGASEHESDAWEARTVANVRAADATLVLTADRPGAGTILTIEAAREAGVPCLVVPIDGPATPEAVARWVAKHAPRTLNVAGDRESIAPGIGVWAERFLSGVFRQLGARGDASG